MKGQSMKFNLQLLGVQFKDYITYDSPLNDCEVQTVKQVLDKQMIKPDNEQEEEEAVARDTTVFLCPLKGLKAARQDIHKFNTQDNITAMCNEV